MSYILDALKKSDRERKQGEVPSLQTVHADLVTAGRKRSAVRRKTLLTGGLCILVAAALALWRWPIPPTPEKIEPPATSQQTVPAPVAEPAEQPPPVQKVTPQVLEPIQQELQTKPPVAERPVIQPEVVIEPAPLLQPGQIPSQTLPKAASEPGSSLPLLKDLPADIQKALPPDEPGAGHVYADKPSRRMIMINTKIVREGEMIGENLRLVKITWDGVILRHISTEFQIKLQ